MIITPNSHRNRDNLPRETASAELLYSLLDTVHLYAPVDEFRWNGAIDGWSKVEERSVVKDNARISPVSFKTAAQYQCRDTGWFVRMSGDYLRCEGSVRRLKQPFEKNLNALASDEFSLILDHIRHLCKLLGLALDPEKLHVARADFARDAVIPYSPSIFVNSVKRLEGFEQLKLQSEPYAATPYARFGNKSRALAFYDKTPAASTGTAKHLIRAEARLLKKATARDADLATLSDLRHPEIGWTIWRKVVTQLLRAAHKRGLDTIVAPDAPALQTLGSLLSEPQLRTTEIAHFIAGKYGLDDFLNEFAGEAGLNDFISRQPVHSERKRRARYEISRIWQYRPDPGGPMARNPWCDLQNWIDSPVEPFSIGETFDDNYRDGDHPRGRFRKSLRAWPTAHKYAAAAKHANSSNDQGEARKEASE